MLLHPDRLAGDYPVRFITFEYRSEGRGKGNYQWDRDPEVSDRNLILMMLRDKLAMCLEDLEMGLDAGVVDVPAGVVDVFSGPLRSTPRVWFSAPELRQRCRSGVPNVSVSPVLQN